MTLAVIGGSGFYNIPALDLIAEHRISTEYALSRVTVFEFTKLDSSGNRLRESLFFIPRHGAEHKIPAHQVNYRANIDALSQLGVDQVISVNAVGSCHVDIDDGELVLPDQVIDYTYNREQTFFDELDDFSDHIDFSWPFTCPFREVVATGLEDIDAEFVDGGVYGCTQGPRFETVAEVKRLYNDGCDIVGMTLMPESALCRERQMENVSICIVVNPGAGVSDEGISLEKIKDNLDNGVEQIQKLLLTLI